MLQQRATLFFTFMLFWLLLKLFCMQWRKGGSDPRWTKLSVNCPDKLKSCEGRKQKNVLMNWREYCTQAVLEIKANYLNKTVHGYGINHTAAAAAEQRETDLLGCFRQIQPEKREVFSPTRVLRIKLCEWIRSTRLRPRARLFILNMLWGPTVG